MTRKPPITNMITFIGCVLAAIDFDDEPALSADEVYDIGADRLLAHELATVNLP